MICRGAAVLKRPSDREIIDLLGFNARINRHHLRVGEGSIAILFVLRVLGRDDGSDALSAEANPPGMRNCHGPRT